MKWFTIKLLITFVYVYHRAIYLTTLFRFNRNYYKLIKRFILQAYADFMETAVKYLTDL